MILATICTVLGVTVATCQSSQLPRTGTLVLNELAYHPDGGRQLEFLELYNPRARAIDLSGWCFTNGVMGCFPAGTVIDADGFTVVAADAQGFQARYDETPAFSYDGHLSNEGERIELRDAHGGVVFACGYGDSYPWPVAADGEGPTLERTGTELDCDDPRSWMASVDPRGATPFRPNSLHDAANPSIANVAISPNPDGTDPIPVRVQARNSEKVWLEYRVGHGTVQTLDLHALDLDGHGGRPERLAGGATFGAEIPALQDSELLRYRVVAEGSSGHRTSEPHGADSVKFRGIVAAGSDSYDLPVLRVYIAPEDERTMYREPEAKTPVPAIVSIGHNVFDGATINLKGSSSLQKPKKKYEVELPKGYTVGQPLFEHPIDRFDLQADISAMTPINEKPAWDTFRYFGVPTVQSNFIRVHIDRGTGISDFHGTYLMREEYDGNWRRRNGYDEGLFLKHGSIPKGTTGVDGGATAFEFIEQVRSLSGPELEAFLLDHLDVPAYVNFMAVSSVIDYDHWGWNFNVNQYRDDRTRRWQYLPLDLDSAYDSDTWQNPDPARWFMEMAEPTFDAETIPGDESTVSRILEKKAFQLPLFRDMYFARLVSIDLALREGQLAQRLYGREQRAGLESFQEDFSKWLPEVTHYHQAQSESHTMDDAASAPATDAALRVAMLREPQRAAELFQMVQEHREKAFDTFISAGWLPRPAGVSTPIQITAVGARSEGSEPGQFIRLHNPATVAVDMSGWFLAGIDAHLPPGAVLAPGACAVIVADDPAYRDSTGGGELVLAEFDAPLDPRGGTIELRRTDGTVAGWRAYEPAAANRIVAGCD